MNKFPQNGHACEHRLHQFEADALSNPQFELVPRLRLCMAVSSLAQHMMRASRTKRLLLKTIFRAAQISSEEHRSTQARHLRFVPHFAQTNSESFNQDKSLRVFGQSSDSLQRNHGSECLGFVQCAERFKALSGSSRRRRNGHHSRSPFESRQCHAVSERAAIHIGPTCRVFRQPRISKPAFAP